MSLILFSYRVNYFLVPNPKLVRLVVDRGLVLIIHVFFFLEFLYLLIVMNDPESSLTRSTLLRIT